MKKLIIFFMFITALNIFAEDSITFHYYYYTNKLYHSTLKTEIIPKDCIFINEYSNNNTYKYIYDFKKKKKLFYKEERISQKYDYNDDEYYNNIETSEIYYDINGNSYKNYSDENMKPNSLYEITNNRFGESFYNHYYENNESINFSRSDSNNYNTNYINKAYKYSLTQNEIINKKFCRYILVKDKNIYDEQIISILCFQNEYYYNGYNYSDEGVQNYNSNGNIEFVYSPQFYYTSTIAQYIDSKDSFLNLLVPKGWYTNTETYYLKEDGYKITNYLDLKSKQIIKKDYNALTNDYLNSVISKSKSTKTYIYLKIFIVKMIWQTM
ncbi:hypothetical protein OFR34_08230 [Brachyspira hyodysenteriae]|nr:hypothetical protein [Brachyspira hyodysenteriae]MDA0000935.1 hypothetical protein [Brachyspira hyodysenteriae]